MLAGEGGVGCIPLCGSWLIAVVGGARRLPCPESYSGGPCSVGSICLRPPRIGGGGGRLLRLSMSVCPHSIAEGFGAGDGSSHGGCLKAGTGLTYSGSLGCGLPGAAFNGIDRSSAISGSALFPQSAGSACSTRFGGGGGVGFVGAGFVGACALAAAFWASA